MLIEYRLARVNGLQPYLAWSRANINWDESFDRTNEHWDESLERANSPSNDRDTLASDGNVRRNQQKYLRGVFFHRRDNNQN